MKTLSANDAIETGYKTRGIFQKMVFKVLKDLHHGHLTIVDGGRKYLFGHDKTLQATIVVHDSSFYRDIALGGSIGAGEAYMMGSWDSPDLTSVIRIMARNIHLTQALDGGLALLTAPFKKWYHLKNRNSQRQSKLNIAMHYDLGNDFFKEFLDPTMAYSSGIFNGQAISMEEASVAKFERICQQVDLKQDDHLIEIGTGWGGFAIYAAQTYGCKVTTTTISEEQYALSKQRIEALGLESQITLLKDDYRLLEGQFDKLVSIEMIEAVGWEYLDTYFDTCRRLLKPKGKACIQAITINDDRYDAARKSVDFIQRYIFPGGFLPSVGAISSHSAKKLAAISRLF
jgi:cyclopropane-fatty-acyl-phospholipid synthase